MTSRELAERAFQASNMRFPGESGEPRAKCLQKLEELFAVVAYLQLDPPGRVLEVGSAAGGTFLAWCGVATEDATLVSVDIQQFDEDQALMRSYAKPGQTVHLVRGDSHALATKLTVENIAYEFDLLFIDADHSEAAVRADWADYSPLVRLGGRVGFHDICDGGPIGDLWEELAHEYPTNVAFVQNRHDGWGGIGVLTV